MHSIHFNDTIVTIPKNSSLAALLIQQESNDKGYAVMINHRFIPQADYSKTILQKDDIVELIAPMQGG